MNKEELVPKTVRLFLQERSASTPLVLGLSGGNDSLSLFFALQSAFKSSIHAVHIDHGWREESQNQADWLERLVTLNGAFWHRFRLPTLPTGVNGENWARDQRLHLFERIRLQVGSTAVLLAHHADDQAETVLKRVCEGARLTKCSGLRPVQQMRSGLQLWRPLLSLTKRQLTAYLNKQEIVPIEDRSNQDRRFLRARMRLETVPFLEKSLGKAVRSNLCRLGQEAQELSCFLQKQCAPYLSSLVKGALGLYLDLSALPPPPLLKEIISACCEEMDRSLSHQERSLASELLLAGKANTWVDKQLYIDRGRLFIPSNLSNLSWQLVETETSAPRLGWQEAWKGGVNLSLPRGEYHLAPAQASAPYAGTNLDHWWTQHKIPAFLRHCIPVLRSGDQVVAELLTGKAPAAEGECHMEVRVRDRLKNMAP